jgi:hypothetical protein
MADFSFYMRLPRLLAETLVATNKCDKNVIFKLHTYYNNKKSVKIGYNLALFQGEMLIILRREIMLMVKENRL